MKIKFKFKVQVYLPSQKKKKSAVSKTLFFHFICVVVKMKIFDDFPLILEEGLNGVNR